MTLTIIKSDSGDNLGETNFIYLKFKKITFFEKNLRFSISFKKFGDK